MSIEYFSALLVDCDKRLDYLDNERARIVAEFDGLKVRRDALCRRLALDGVGPYALNADWSRYISVTAEVRHSRGAACGCVMLVRELSTGLFWSVSSPNDGCCISRGMIADGGPAAVAETKTLAERAYRRWLLDGAA